MEKIFKLRTFGTTMGREMLCGLTTFLTLSYILFVNPAVMAQSGMPAEGLFAATIVVSAALTIAMGLVANVPLAMATGMGLNNFFSITVCTTLGFHWREGLAISFLAGLLHVLIMASGLRKTLVLAIPRHLKLAFGVGLGMFIAYIGLKNAGVLSFSIPFGQYDLTPSGTIVGGASTVPSFTTSPGRAQVVALAGLSIMCILLALEKKTGDSYAALPMGIVSATALGIPLGVTNPAGMVLFDFSSLDAMGEICLAIFGRPGLMSLFDSSPRALVVIMTILTCLMINIIDSVGTIMGIGQIEDAEVYNHDDMEKFARPGGLETRLDKTLLINSCGGLSALFGLSTVTCFMESVTGIAAGGRTGLTAVTVGVLFLLCLPFGGVFTVIPGVAIAPALIVAGAFMVPLAARINWSDFQESFPAFMTILWIPLTYSFVYGIASGVITHVLIQIALGNWRKVHPMLYIFAGLFGLALAGVGLH